MSDTKGNRGDRRAARAAAAAAAGGAAAPAAAAAAGHEAGTFQIVASGENVVMVNTATGQTWAMTSDGARPVWHPVSFEGGAERAPRRPGGKKAASPEAEE
jgi:hypothetical protein